MNDAANAVLAGLQVLALGSTLGARVYVYARRLAPGPAPTKKPSFQRDSYAVLFDTGERVFRVYGPSAGDAAAMLRPGRRGQAPPPEPALSTPSAQKVLLHVTHGMKAAVTRVELQRVGRPQATWELLARDDAAEREPAIRNAAAVVFQALERRRRARRELERLRQEKLERNLQPGGALYEEARQRFQKRARPDA